MSDTGWMQRSEVKLSEVSPAALYDGTLGPTQQGERDTAESCGVSQLSVFTHKTHTHISQMKHIYFTHTVKHTDETHTHMKYTHADA